jgi:hypothetical protein
MASVLNVFKTYTANLTTTGSTVYTAPAGYTTVVLMAQVSNIGNSSVTITANYVPIAAPSSPTTIISGIQIPTNDAVNLMSGRLILMTGDSVFITASSNNAAQALFSVLETLNQ